MELMLPVGSRVELPSSDLPDMTQFTHSPTGVGFTATAGSLKARQMDDWERQHRASAPSRLSTVLGHAGAAYLKVVEPPSKLLVLPLLTGASWYSLFADVPSSFLSAASVLLASYCARSPILTARRLGSCSALVAFTVCLLQRVPVLVDEVAGWAIASIFLITALAFHFQALAHHYRAAARVDDVAVLATDDMLLSAMPDNAATIARAWLEGRTRLSPQLESVLRLATLHALIVLSIEGEHEL